MLCLTMPMRSKFHLLHYLLARILPGAYLQRRILVRAVSSQVLIEAEGSSKLDLRAALQYSGSEVF